ncbi:hypothetical protein [Moritella sp.]|uniref:hypothetical protein n=1 Tax=Moritella sp. TaxID=78556 RepID=UPI001DA17AD0|nr:hypothetical protein [Moritella sp.]MCJ8349240.1 hypothetical protein [Moritella sp.]NQZ39528.1 hypothetical protein [Moritella sp.]
MLKSEQKISRFSLWMEELFQRLENDYCGIVVKAVKYRLLAKALLNRLVPKRLHLLEAELAEQSAKTLAAKTDKTNTQVSDVHIVKDVA